VVSDEDKVKVSHDGMMRVLDVLSQTGIRATMFITWYFAEHCPDVMDRMIADGHEIASHGMNHTHFEPAHLEQSRHLLEQRSGQRVVGFRMARLAPVKKEDILKAGFQYESSLNPIWLPGRYSNLGQPLLPFKEDCGLRQYPISAVPWCRFPLFWLSFKNLPLFAYKWLTRFAIGRTKYYNMFSHPWEYNEAARDKKWKIPGYVTRHAGPDQCERLRSLIEYLKQFGEFRTFRDVNDQLNAEEKQP